VAGIWISLATSHGSVPYWISTKSVEGFLGFLENSIYDLMLIIQALSEISMAVNWNHQAILVKSLPY
jgi:hypothetical protein